MTNETNNQRYKRALLKELVDKLEKNLVYLEKQRDNCKEQFLMLKIRIEEDRDTIKAIKELIEREN